MIDRTAPKRPNADMIAVERDYRTGILSNRELARVYGVTEGAIRKWAKANGWTRDLEARVRAAIANRAIREIASDHLDLPPPETVRTETVRSRAVRDPARTQSIDQMSDQEIVETFADAGAAAIRLHRRDVNILRNRRDRLMKHFERAIGNLGSPVVSQDGTVVATSTLRLPDIALGISILDTASRVDERIVKIERQALQIDRQQNEAPPPDPEAEAKREASRQLAYRILADMARRVAPAEPLTIDGLPSEPGEGQERG